MASPDLVLIYTSKTSSPLRESKPTQARKLCDRRMPTSESSEYLLTLAAQHLARSPRPNLKATGLSGKDIHDARHTPFTSTKVRHTDSCKAREGHPGPAQEQASRSRRRAHSSSQGLHTVGLWVSAHIRKLGFISLRNRRSVLPVSIIDLVVRGGYCTIRMLLSLALFVNDDRFSFQWRARISGTSSVHSPSAFAESLEAVSLWLSFRFQIPIRLLVLGQKSCRLRISVTP